MDLHEIGLEIRKARKAKGITQSALASELGMSEATISQIETGSISEIGIRKILRIMDCVGLVLLAREDRSSYTLEDAQADNKLMNEPQTPSAKRSGKYGV